MTSTDNSATTRRSKATGAALTGVLPPFPGIHPQPHQITEWIEAFADKSSGLGLQAVLAGNLPRPILHATPGACCIPRGTQPRTQPMHAMR